MSLLIHSMSEFSDIILGCLHAAEARNLVEVGAEFGGMSQQLAAYAQIKQGHLTSIDPAPKPEFAVWAQNCPSITHLAEASLDAMPKLASVDAWVIDGDHNYYTVFNELLIADQTARRDGRPLLAFLHDVSWPTGRRDMYYAPDRIPAEWRHPHSYEGGAFPNDAGLHRGRGFRGMGHFAFALHEGGPRNGVLTAVEDFLEQGRTVDRPLAFAHVPAVFGLGIVFDASSPWAAEIAQIVHPYHDNALMASLERNRLRNYLAVIDWQDRQAA